MKNDASPPLAAWPPPGLERLRGDLWRVIDRLGMGAAILSLPLLAAMTVPQSPWRTGIFGEAWWVLLITSPIGLWLLLVGYVELFRVVRRWLAATKQGYQARTAALVLADRSGDAGFLVQGGRAYSVIGEGTRNALLQGRLARAGLGLGAALWGSAGFVAGVFLAARGALGPAALARWTLLPPLVAGGIALVLTALENTALRAARKQWHAQPWSRDLAKDDIRDWHAAVAARAGAVTIAEGDAGEGSPALRGAAVATALVAAAVFVFAVPVVMTSGIGPALAEIAVPRFSATARRAARAEALTSLRVPVDPEITSLMAGEALLSVTPPSGELFREPPRSHDEIFAGDEYSENPTGLAAHFWARDLVPRLADGLDPEVERYLDELGRHSALQELGILARAGSLDEMGAFYVLPFADDVALWEFPIPKFSGIREVGYAQVGAAVGAAASGQVGDAERRLRELISAGLLMGRDGTTLISNLVGFVLAATGGEALANLYAATGRADAAEELTERMDLAERAALTGSVGLGTVEFSSMPEIVTDTTAIRGMRWEFLALLSALGPCLNLNRAIFGPPDDHEAWRRQVRASLVRFDSEEELFRVAERGWGLEQGEGALRAAADAFARVMGGGLGACAELGAAAAASM